MIPAPEPTTGCQLQGGKRLKHLPPVFDPDLFPAVGTECFAEHMIKLTVDLSRLREKSNRVASDLRCHHSSGNRFFLDKNVKGHSLCANLRFPPSTPGTSCAHTASRDRISSNTIRFVRKDLNIGLLPCFRPTENRLEFLYLLLSDDGDWVSAPFPIPSEKS